VPTAGSDCWLCACCLLQDSLALRFCLLSRSPALVALALAHMHTHLLHTPFTHTNTLKHPSKHPSHTTNRSPSRQWGWSTSWTSLSHAAARRSWRSACTRQRMRCAADGCADAVWAPSCNLLHHSSFGHRATCSLASLTPSTQTPIQTPNLNPNPNPNPKPKPKPPDPRPNRAHQQTPQPLPAALLTRPPLPTRQRGQAARAD